MDDKNIKGCIKISERLDKSVLDGFERGKKFKKENKKINKGLGRWVKVAGVLIAVTAGIGIAKPELVEAIPGISMVFELFSGSENYKYKQYAKGMELVTADKGISIKLEEIAMDERKFVSTYIVEGEGVYGDKIDVELRPSFNDDITGSTNRRTIKLEDNKVAVLCTTDISDLKLDDNFNVSIIGGGIIRDGDELNGNWDLKFKVNKKDILIDTKNIQLNKEVNIGDEKLNFKELLISPIGSTLKILAQSNSNVKDEIGNYHYIIKDDSGNYLRNDNTGGFVNPEDGERYTKIDILDDLSNLKYINVIPVKTEQGNIYKEYGNGEDSRVLNSTIGTGKEVIRIDSEENFGYYNINKENFFKINDLKNKKIKVNKTNTVTITDVGNDEMTMNIDGYYDIANLYAIEFIDEDLNVIKGNVEYEELRVNNETGEITIKMPKLNKDKKYNIAIPGIIDLEFNDDDGVKIYND